MALPFPKIDPVAVQIGPFAIRWYALAYVAGLVGGWWYARRLAAASHLWGAVRRPKPQDIDDLVTFVAFGIVLGGRLGYVLFYNFQSYLAQPLEIFALWRGGMSFHGGLLGAIVAIVLLARLRGLNPLSLLDIVAVVAPIGLFFGRLANFVNGELWGRPAPDFPYAFVFPNAGEIPRHPSQLYEAFGEGLLLFVILGLAARRLGFERPGFLGGLFLCLYALIRIACEFFREPDAQLGFLFGDSLPFLSGGITMGMILSVPMALFGLCIAFLAIAGWTGSKANPISP